MPDSAQFARMISYEFYHGRFDLSERGLTAGATWSLMPEVEAVQQLRVLGAANHIIRVFLTLVSAMDRARDATRLWRAAVKLFEQHPEVFNPDDILSMSTDAATALLRQAGVSQRHGPDTEAWRRIAESLASRTGPVCRLVESGCGDAAELMEDLRAFNRAGQSRYPMLRGPKIGPMWVRIMANPGGAKIESIDSIPVAVDRQVRRATEYLGVSDTVGLRLEDAKPIIQSAWRNAVVSTTTGGPSEINGTCAALDPALWIFGKFGCSHCERVGRRSPISSACRHCRYPARMRRAVIDNCLTCETCVERMLVRELHSGDAVTTDNLSSLEGPEAREGLPLRAWRIPAWRIRLLRSLGNRYDRVQQAKRV